MSELVYLAAPYTHSDPEVVKQRMELYYKVDAELMKNGIMTASPLLKHALLAVSDLPGDWEYWKEYALRLLSSCDRMIIIGMDGWDKSTGVAAEIEFCEDNDIPYEVLYVDDTGEAKDPEFLSPDEIIKTIVETAAEESITWLRATPKEELIIQHLWWGRSIRNEFHLWHENNPFTNYEDPLGPTHPDQMSMYIMEGVWDHFNQTK